MKFRIKKKCHNARSGLLELQHGSVRTPVFMTIGTYGAVRGLCKNDLENCKTEMMLCNAYHLMNNVANICFDQSISLHEYISWDKPILTDSGGYQVFSLSSLTKISEEGVTFKSPQNGDTIFLSPEKAIDVQIKLGSDIMMIFDECAKYPLSWELTRTSMELSLHWARLSKNSNYSSNPLFGIVQGGMYDDLREISLNELLNLNFDGYALGGLSVGEPNELREDIVTNFAPKLPFDKPRYLMGVGKPQDIIRAVNSGIDMFDCVIPTRNGRNGQLFTNNGTVNIRNKKYENDLEPIDSGCPCFTCKNYSKSMLRHLDKCNDALAARLMSIHNVYFYQDLMSRIRASIENDSLDALSKDIIEAFEEKK